LIDGRRVLLVVHQEQNYVVFRLFEGHERPKAPLDMQMLERFP